jgi:hypothetical protein
MKRGIFVTGEAYESDFSFLLCLVECSNSVIPFDSVQMPLNAFRRQLP